MKLLVNGHEIVVTNFPGGEVKVVVPPSLPRDLSVYSVAASLDSSDAVMALVMLTDALHQWTRFDHRSHFNLALMYVPYARQDRVCNPGESHGVRAFARIINGLGYDSVIVLDPHSEAVAAAINNCLVVEQHEWLSKMLGKTIREKNWILVSPDSGSEKKVNRAAKELGSWGLTPPVLYANKQRNLATGAIIATAVYGSCAGRDVLIVDDICDGGRTFIQLAKELKSKGAREVNLYVTHGIFSAGLDVLKEDITHVWCAHSLKGVTDKAFLTIGD